jgi:hypothetical protein
MFSNYYELKLSIYYTILTYTQILYETFGFFQSQPLQITCKGSLEFII